MKRYYFLSAIGVIGMSALLPACVSKSSYDEVKSKYDSLENSKLSMQQELNDYLITMNEISENFDKIKGIENVVQVDVQNELKSDHRQKLANDLSYINDLISNNHEKIAALEQKLSKSTINTNQLRQTISRLNGELNATRERVAQLESIITEKDGTIFSLHGAIDSLNKHIGALDKNVSALHHEASEKQKVIANQNYELNSAWFVIGTARELKEQKILTAGGLFSAPKVMKNDFNHDYFSRIDIRETTIIPLNSAKVKILTNHPASSYTLVQANPADKKNKNLILKIDNPADFWSLSKFLVLEVK